MTDKYIRPLLRTFAVAALLSFFIATDVLCMFIDARAIHLHGFEEDSFVEWCQQIQIFIAIVVMVVVMWKNRNPAAGTGIYGRLLNCCLGKGVQ